MKIKLVVIVVLFLAAIVLRFANIGHFQSATGDEAMHVENAYSFSEHGYLGPDKWYHPPLKHLLTYASIKTFGDTASGRRIRNVFTGAASIVVLFLTAEALGFSMLSAIICSLMLCFDPLHIAFSRTTFEDIPAVFFLLLGMYLCLIWIKTRRRAVIIATGVAFGLAFSLRIYSVNLIIPILACLCYESVLRGKKDELPLLFSSFVVIPFLIFLTTYLPWFARGYGLSEWLQLQRYALVEMTGLKDTLFNNIIMLLAQPSNWFIRVVGVGFKGGGDDGTLMVVMNNLPIWIMIIPSLIFMLFDAIRSKKLYLAIVPILFMALYIPYLLAARPLFLYSSLPLLPLGFLSIVYTLHRVLTHTLLYFALAVVVWGFYLYPLTIGFPVPTQMYQPLLDQIHIVGPR